MTDDLVTWLRAQLDADERDARDRRGVWPRPSVEDGGAVWLHVQRGGNAVVARYPYPGDGYSDMTALRAWAEPEGGGWHTERVLAEVDAKRRVLERHAECGSAHGYCDDGGHTWKLDDGTGICDDKRDLASPYADRPGYREEWRP